MRKPNEIKIDTVERLLQEVINRTKLDEILERNTLMENRLIAAWGENYKFHNRYKDIHELFRGYHLHCLRKKGCVTETPFIFK